MTENTNPALFSSFDLKEALYFTVTSVLFHSSHFEVLCCLKSDGTNQLLLWFLMPVAAREVRMERNEGSYREKSESRQITGGQVYSTQYFSTAHFSGPLDCCCKLGTAEKLLFKVIMVSSYIWDCCAS